jgi:hypothetical protein
MDDNISGLWWGVGVVGALASALTLTLGRGTEAPGQAAAPPTESETRQAA